MMDRIFHVRLGCALLWRNLGHFTGSDQQIIASLARGNYALNVDAVSTDDSALMASEAFEPVFLFGPDIFETQSAAGSSIL